MANTQDKFVVSSYTVNFVTKDDVRKKFPGNIAPEGYFYSPFYEISLKELDDEVQSAPCTRINFSPSDASVIGSSTTFYDPELGVFSSGTLYLVTIMSPILYDFIEGQPFVIYDVSGDTTFLGFLEKFQENSNGTCRLQIATETRMENSLLNGSAGGGKSAYIISLLEDNVPSYAEYIPSTQRVVWRGPKKMSDLTSESPLYNMPFTNGRLYIHKNLDVFVRRQDPHGEYKLFKPSDNNPLQRYKIEGTPKLDFDTVKYIIDSMVDAC